MRPPIDPPNGPPGVNHATPARATKPAKTARKRARPCLPRTCGNGPQTGQPGKVCKGKLTFQTQKNPARGRDRLGLDSQTNRQKSEIGNCWTLSGLSDCRKVPTPARTVSRVQKIGGLPGSFKHVPHAPAGGSGLYCARMSSKSRFPRLRP